MLTHAAHVHAYVQWRVDAARLVYLYWPSAPGKWGSPMNDTDRPARRIFALLLVCLMPNAAAAAVRLNYRLVDTWTEGNQATTAYRVTQEGSAAVARSESGDAVALASKPGAGLRAARRDDNVPFLVDVFDAPSELGPGTRLYGNAEGVVRKVEYHLTPDDQTRMVQGHRARHSVLTIVVEWNGIQPDGSRPLNRSIGHADLWTAEDLPFSWLPYATPVGFSMAAVPLSFQHPEVASYVVDALAPKLRALGLLLEADARSSIILSVGPKQARQEFARRVSVEDLKQGGPALDAKVFRRPTLTEPRYEALMSALVAAGQACSGRPPGSLHIEHESRKRVVGKGHAAVVPPGSGDESADDSVELVLGSVKGTPACWVFVLRTGRSPPGALRHRAAGVGVENYRGAEGRRLLPARQPQGAAGHGAGRRHADAGSRRLQGRRDRHREGFRLDRRRRPVGAILHRRRRRGVDLRYRGSRVEATSGGGRSVGARLDTGGLRRLGAPAHRRLGLRRQRGYRRRHRPQRPLRRGGRGR